ASVAGRGMRDVRRAPSAGVSSEREVVHGGCGGVRADCRDADVAGGCRRIKLAGAEHFVVGSLEYEVGLVRAGDLALVLPVDARVLAHGGDAFVSAGFGRVAFAGEDDLVVACLQVEHELVASGFYDKPAVHHPSRVSWRLSSRRGGVLM